MASWKVGTVLNVSLMVAMRDGCREIEQEGETGGEIGRRKKGLERVHNHVRKRKEAARGSKSYRISAAASRLNAQETSCLLDCLPQSNPCPRHWKPTLFYSRVSKGGPCSSRSSSNIARKLVRDAGPPAHPDILTQEPWGVPALCGVRCPVRGF